MPQADSASITRRGLISGAAALAVPAIPAIALPLGKDAEILQLGEDLRRLWALERSAKGDAEVSAAVAATTAIVCQIEQASAQTKQGLQVKAAAFLWCHDGSLDSALLPGQATDEQLAKSIIRDLIG